MMMMMMMMITKLIKQQGNIKFSKQLNEKTSCFHE